LFEKGVRCNPTLAMAIGLGHDLGHAPFGHSGEKILNELTQEIGGFKHEQHGLRIVDKIEKPSAELPVIGLNLTLATRDGIVNHCGESNENVLSPSDIPEYNDVGKRDVFPCSIEGCVVRLSDKIAYLGRDVEDATMLKPKIELSLPARVSSIIGHKNGEIVDYFVKDIIDNSSEDEIKLSKDASELMEVLKQFNYENIYNARELQDLQEQIEYLIKITYEKLLFIIENYEDNIQKYRYNRFYCIKMFGEFISDRKKLYFSEEADIYSDSSKLYLRIVADFISTLSDRFIIQAFSELHIPKAII